MPPATDTPAPPATDPSAADAAEASAVLRRIVDFCLSFARRQAAEVREVPGGVAVLHPRYAGSHEHNQLVVGAAADPGELAARADAVLGHLPHRRITVLDDSVGTACAPVLTAAGYVHASELVMVYGGRVPPLPDAAADSVTLADLRPALLRRLRTWMPLAGDEAVRHLADRRTARLRGADDVRFLAARDAHGEVAAWADLYLDRAARIAQIEDLVTADAHVRRGHAGTVLTTALHHAAGCGALVFLLADPEDWPRTWYSRRGFTTISSFHVFTRMPGRTG